MINTSPLFNSSFEDDQYIKKQKLQESNEEDESASTSVAGAAEAKLEPTKRHFDAPNSPSEAAKMHGRRLLLRAEPQIGKTGAYLKLISLLRQRIHSYFEISKLEKEKMNGSTPTIILIDILDDIVQTSSSYSIFVATNLWTFEVEWCLIPDKSPTSIAKGIKKVLDRNKVTRFYTTPPFDQDRNYIDRLNGVIYERSKITTAFSFEHHPAIIQNPEIKYFNRKLVSQLSKTYDENKDQWKDNINNEIRNYREKKNLL
jgi:hypothetical protein